MADQLGAGPEHDVPGTIRRLPSGEVYVKRRVRNPRHAIYGAWVAVVSVGEWGAVALHDEELNGSVITGTVLGGPTACPGVGAAIPPCEDLLSEQHPSDFPLGTILRHSESGRLAVRFQQDDTTGKGMHAWYVPASNPAEARALHHVEVRGWELVELPAGVAEVVRAVLQRQAAEYARAVEDWTGNDERVLAENQRLANENLRLAEELAGMADMGRKACDHYTEQIETLQRAILDVAGYPADVQWPGNRKAIGDLRAEVDRLTRERDDARADAAADEATLDTATRRLAEALNLNEVPLDDMLHTVTTVVDQRDTAHDHRGELLVEVERLRRELLMVPAARPAIPADATYVESLKDDLALAGDEASAFRDLLSSIWLYVSWRSITKRLTTEQKELWADAIEASGDPDEPTEVDRWWRDVAPVSGSDTTEDER